MELYVHYKKGSIGYLLLLNTQTEYMYLKNLLWLFETVKACNNLIACAFFAYYSQYIKPAKLSQYST